MQVRYQAALRPDSALDYTRRNLRSWAQQLPDFLQLLSQRGGRHWSRWHDRCGQRRRCARCTAGFGSLAFETMACAVDREPLFVEQVPNAPDQQHFVVLIVTAVAATLDRFQLREFLFPITKHVRLDRTELAHLANREITFGGN